MMMVGELHLTKILTRLSQAYIFYDPIPTIITKISQHKPISYMCSEGMPMSIMVCDRCGRYGTEAQYAHHIISDRLQDGCYALGTFYQALAQGLLPSPYRILPICTLLLHLFPSLKSIDIFEGILYGQFPRNFDILPTQRFGPMYPGAPVRILYKLALLGMENFGSTIDFSNQSWVAQWDPEISPFLGQFLLWKGTYPGEIGNIQETLRHVILQQFPGEEITAILTVMLA